MKNYVKFSDSAKKSHKNSSNRLEKGGNTFFNNSNSPTHENQVNDLGGEMSMHFKEKIVLLEKENALLRNEISMGMNEKGKFDYFLRLRKDLIEEIQVLRNDLVLAEMTKNVEIERMSEQLECIKKQNSFKERDSPVKRQKSGNVSNNSEFMKLQQDRSFTSNQKKILNLSNYHATEEKKRDSSKNRGSNSDNDYEINQNSTYERDLQSASNTNLVTSNPISSRREKTNNTTTEDLHYQSNLIIAELKDQNTLFENSLNASKEECEKLKEQLQKVMDGQQGIIDNMQREIDNWKRDHDILLVRQKTMFDEFSEVYLEKEQDLNKVTQESQFNLEKKSLYYESLCINLSSEIELIKETNSNLLHQSEAKCKQTSDQNQRLITKYEEMYKTFEEDLLLMAEHITKMKGCNTNREKQMLDLKEYYNKAIEEYKKPIMEIKKNRFEKKEEIFVSQLKEIEQLRNSLEEYTAENAKLKIETMEAKPTFRKKFTETSIKFEEFLTEFSGNHDSLDLKLQSLKTFMQYFEDKFTFFQSLINDKKSLEEKNQALECKIKMFHSKHNEAEIIDIKQQLIKANKDLTTKTQLIRNMEAHMKGKEEKIKKLSSNPTPRNKNSNIEATNPKFTEEITTLTSQISVLLSSKEDLEKFYKAELNKCLGVINDKTEKIVELSDLNKKMENDYFGKKETVFNLWMLEFEEFKAKLLSVNELKKVCAKFEAAGNQLKELKNDFLSEELMLLRNESKGHEDHDNDYKRIYTRQIEAEQKIHNELKKKVEDRIILLDELNYKRHIINESLEKEKELISKNETEKKEVLNKEENLSKEEKSLVNSFFKHLVNTKEDEINELRTEIDRLNSDILLNKENFKSHFEEMDKSVKNQISLIKERENFTVKQFSALEDKFNNYMIEKDRIIYLQKEELDDMMNSNKYMSRIKLGGIHDNINSSNINTANVNKTIMTRQDTNNTLNRSQLNTQN